MAGKPIVLREDLGVVRRHATRAGCSTGTATAWSTSKGRRRSSPGARRSSFFRLDRLRETGIRFDARIRPNFEDGHFAVHYLLTLDKPLVGILRDCALPVPAPRSRHVDEPAEPRHAGPVRRRPRARLPRGDGRRRGALRPHPGVAPAGDRLRAVVVPLGGRQDHLGHRPDRGAPPRFHELLGRILRRLDPRSSTRTRCTSCGRSGRTSSRTPTATSPGTARSWSGARSTGQWASSASATGSRAPCRRSAIVVDAAARSSPAWAKTRGQSYFGRARPRRTGSCGSRSARTSMCELDDVRCRRPSSGGRRARKAPRRPMGGTACDLPALPPGYIAARSRGGFGASPGAGSGRLARVATKVPGYGTRFRDAWVVMDRVHNADDNGERLFEHLRASRPDINAWFVLEQGTPDWRRLARPARGGSSRGARSSGAAAPQARWLVSSHADRGLVAPPEIVRRR